MGQRFGQTWREWFFEVFAVNSRMPFHPLPTTEAERLERAERDTPKDITRLGLGDEDSRGASRQAPR